MKAGFLRKLVICTLAGTLFLSVCGCNEGMKWHPVYEAAIVGGIVGAIVGHQHDEDCKGAVIGSAIGALGRYLEQYDNLAGAEEVVVEVASEDGAVIPVVLKKKDGTYFCPNGEHYNKLPSQEELRVIFGL
ncbi:MAG: hypothetical protein JW715_15050 [Sedimentisphaerales bacterium]|nr:hypothetical protein [Sedimentisphaerales bacterium]